MLETSKRESSDKGLVNTKKSTVTIYQDIICTEPPFAYPCGGGGEHVIIRGRTPAPIFIGGIQSRIFPRKLYMKGLKFSNLRKI